MLSVASVGSAGGAANYFAKDDYYLGDGPGELSEWGGRGADALGLSGNVTKEAFEGLLNSRLPDGTEVNKAANARAGVDFTFSLSKSASILALVTGDKRILEAHQQAVKQTMAWVEKNFAEARDRTRNPNGEPVRTGNLVYALFQHDTSRKLDPQSHIHVVIAAMTQTAEGKWKALWNGELWKNNTVIGSAYHAFARENMQRLGYQTEITGKHGQWEIAGVPRAVIDPFSQRRQEVLEKAKEIGVSTPQGQDRVVVNTRDAKLAVEDKEALRSGWQERAAELGFDGKDLVRDAMARAQNGREKPIGSPARVQELLEPIRAALKDYVRPADPLATNGLSRALLTPSGLRTEMAVASAVRIIGQREAAFGIHQVGKTALDLGLKGVTVDKVDARIGALLEQGQLIPGRSDRIDGVVQVVTTPEHLQQERQLLAQIDRGRNASQPIVPAADVADRLQAVAGDRSLNGEQLGAATLALSTSDRMMVVQGVAGAGKTTMIEAMANVAREEGKEVLGLAFANKMVSMLRDDAKIEAQTVSSFVNAHLRGALAGQGPNFETSKAALAGKVLVLDEASLVANEQMNNLATIANAYEVDRLVMIGDHNQLQPIDAGKAFSLIQSHDPAMARMDTSLRQKTEHMQQVATLTREGKFREAFEVLGERVQQVGKGESHVEVAADKWLALSPENRERTALYASGRVARIELNELVQDGLKTEGVLKGEGLGITTLLQVNATREELRYARTYHAGQVLDVVRNKDAGGLSRGRYEVLRTNARGEVTLRDENGKRIRFDPSRIDPQAKNDALQLSEKERIKLHEGDTIRWTATDKARDLLNSETAKVLSVSGEMVTVATARGEVIELAAGDKMLERLGLSYAINMHQAQGMTTDQGIGVMHSSERFLSNQRLTHVMATRVREDIEIVTNDKDQLIRAIERNPGDKSSALEATGDKDLRLDRGSTSPGIASALGPPRNGPVLPPELKVDLDKLPPLPGLTMESMRATPQLDLPERNIERSR
ncbi:ATPase AAA [Croceibacterium mercuriale]|uniref:ATPase AAA n=1 Tax=Croceibacterium mercuriale TaxID=1572751 RepID=A0A0B2BWT9_9SPHN|nr:MobF family relaxase [Croceibacterium mercuriale]KHL24295.1 ATPase AAA [Croceibacterium mercuriale]